MEGLETQEGPRKLEGAVRDALTKWDRECYCGTKDQLPAGDLTYAPNQYSVCNYPCPANARESCGGWYTGFDIAISLYERESMSFSPPASIIPSLHSPVPPSPSPSSHPKSPGSSKKWRKQS